MLYNSLETPQRKLSKSHKGIRTLNFLHRALTIALGWQSGGTDVGRSATIYPAICLHFHFYFPHSRFELSEEFPPVAVRQDHQEQESGYCRNEEKRPKQPAVHGLCQHPPLSPYLIILGLLVFLVQQIPHDFH